MPCDELVDQNGNTVGYVCTATVTDMEVLPWECGNCHERLMLVRFEGYYGTRSTCLCCGEEFFDDEWAQRPRPGDPDCCRDWRKKRIAAARKEWECWFEECNPPYEEIDEVNDTECVDEFFADKDGVEWAADAIVDHQERAYFARDEEE